MSKPLPTSHPMFRMIEKQLCDALQTDHNHSPDAQHRFMGKLGPQAKAVLAEILGATRPIQEAIAVTGYPPGNSRTYAEQAAQALGAIKPAPGDPLGQGISANAPNCDLPVGRWYCCLKKGHAGPCAETHSPHGDGSVQFINHSKTVGVPATGRSEYDPFAGPQQFVPAYMPAAYTKLEAELKEAHAEIERLTGIIHTPETDYFLKGVSIEAEYQRELHEARDVEKSPSDWVACITYLLTKAVLAIALGRIDKAKHHMVTAAAACKRWHSYAPETQNGEEGQRPL